MVMPARRITNLRSTSRANKPVLSDDGNSKSRNNVKYNKKNQETHCGGCSALASLQEGVAWATTPYRST